MIMEGSSLSVHDWLQRLHLDQYKDNFEKNDYRCLSDCKLLSDKGLAQIGVLLPGHRKRILSAIEKWFSEGFTEEWLEDSPVVRMEDLPKPGSRPVPMPRTRKPARANSLPLSPAVMAVTDMFAPRATAKDIFPGGSAINPELHQQLPPVPPRAGCRPPVKFSSRPSLATSERPVYSLLGPVEFPADTLVDLTPNASTTAIARNGSNSRVEDSEKVCKMVVPPLPAKRVMDRKKSAMVPIPPVPRKVPLLPPRKPASSTPPLLPEVEFNFPPPSVSPPNVPPPSIPPPLLPRIKPQRPSLTGADTLMTTIRPPPEFDVTDYEDVEPTLACMRIVDIQEKPGPVTMRGAPLPRIPTILSDYESDEYEDIIHSDANWNDGKVSIQQSGSSVSSGSSGKYSSIMDNGAPHPSPLIKAGWLDKNPPQGSYIYQKRWVKLDTEYLRYYDSDKDMYSKRFIPVNLISRVTVIGDQKFEVTTQNRIFVFRAESDADRSDWVRVFEQVIRERRNSMSQSGSSVVDTDKAGLLELKGYKSKTYVVVAGDKVFLYKNNEDFRMGIGVTLIEMNVGNVRDIERKGFDLTTPYKIFSFTADSDTEKEEWVEAMRESIAEALSTMEVAEKIWSVEANRYCADCGAPNPDWASINLCVVFCKRCAGEHRSLGPGVSKVRSLKMDGKIWREELIQLFQRIGNVVANQFWAANVPESEAIHPRSGSAERKRFIASKYKEGKYRRYHQLFGNQEELNKALCATVTTSDLAETLSLLFCGAEVACYSGDPAFPSPVALAEQASQRLQMEFLFHNKNSELPRVDVSNNMEKLYSVARPSITHNGFLYKTASMSKAANERKSREEFSRRWCVLNDGVLSYFESDKNLAPNGEIKMSEIVCLAVNPVETHGYTSTFEIYTESERLYLFGSDDAAAVKEWVKSIAKSFIPSRAEDMVIHDFERIGRLQYTARLGQESSKLGWFALVHSTLYACMEESEREEVIHLKKLSELSIKGDNDNVLILGEKSRTLYIQGEKKLAFSCWVSAIQKAAGTSSDTLSGQQLTESDIPVIVYRCIDYITRYGLTSEGIYRKSGQNSKTTNLLELFKKDARRVWLVDGEHQVDDVANTLKRFFRYIGEGIFTEFYRDWLSTPAINFDVEKVQEYQRLLRKLPPVNKATLKALVNHLYCVQNFSSSNQMNTHNLAIVFGPTLFQTDGQDNKPGQVVEDLIDHYVRIFSVSEQELRTQREEIDAINKIKEACQRSRNTSRDFICSVFFEEKSEDKEHNIQIPASMTADQVTFEILERKQIQRKEKDCWSCFELNEKEEMERPLHYCEKVLPIYQSLGTDGCLVVKKHLSMEAMLIYLASKVEGTKHGMMKFYEERSLMGRALSTGSFHDRYFILNSTSLRLYKEVRNLRRQSLTAENSHKPDREWPVKNITIHLGIKKKIRPPTCWGFTMIYENERHEKSLWYLCCDTQPEMREWFATFLHVQHSGNVWPLESAKVRVSGIQRDSKLGNLSLIPLRGNANEMRNSVAAFTSEPLTLIREV